MNNDREKIIERIKKLLAVADNRGATEHEAAAAALAAQRLIAQYDVEQWEIHSKDAEPIETIYANDATRRWRWHLADVIAPAFRCKTYQTRRWSKECGRYVHLMGFYGYKTDATAAAMTFNSLYKIGNRLASRFSRDAAYGTYNAYVNGFVDGIVSELEKQTEALMIIVPPKVNEQYEIEHGGMKSVDTTLKLGSGIDAYAAYREGVQEGRNAVRSHRIEEPETEFVADAPALMGA
ncbi:DUF2786 domain-containing protein [Adlercreutzia equolifaciens]|uniref:DUF2786 domain-containing protein n=1 Tax=Adlercreutzia equolifaciens TaxID=446660 RepID=UPI00266D26C0|nr:DUF2786 domain-containing protein [Adlercreutzia equolifaciens]